MDGGPFRVSRSAERRVTSSRPDSSEQSTESQPVHEEKRETHRPAAPRHVSNVNTQEPKKRWKLIAAAIIAVVVVGIIGWLALSVFKAPGVAIDGSKYQAVFFTNGQVYFGKLKVINAEYMELGDVYYLQAKTAESEDSKLQSTTDNANLDNVTMIKLGQEIHGPEDKMTINKDQVLFYENLKTDGKVSQAIDQHKKQ